MKIIRQRTKTLGDFLSADLMNRILSAGVTRRFADGQMIQQRGDKSNTMCFVKSGVLIAGNLGMDGALLASAILYPGEHFGDFTLFGGVPRTQNIWTQGETEIVEVPGARFLAIMDQEPAIARALLTISTLRNFELVELLDMHRRLPLPARISRLLLTAADPDSQSETIECRQEDLAFMLGVSRVSIGKALKKLQDEGLIEMGFGRIHLPDVQRYRAQVDSEHQLLPLDL
ncbi:MAG: Crp/Fnr family transcriptional regulator [Alphaproteobacteria bacterium]|nr:MAG: Crp/Fnr family transcriptional regulator [Alphaproteobacteria bacterium]